MATIYALKPRFQSLLRPVAGQLARRGLTANQLTVAAMVLSAAGGGFLLLAPASPLPLLVLPAVLLVRMALNALDGMLAREHGQASRLGGWLNELGDVLSDALLYLPLGLVKGVNPLLVALVVVLGACAELAGVLARTLGGPRRYEGPLGKSDRAFAFGTLALLLGMGVRRGAWIDGLLVGMAALGAATILRRSQLALAAPGVAQTPGPGGEPP